MPSDLAVVIVLWNARDFIQAALESLLADLENSGLDTAVWVVDSASSDGGADLVAERFPDVHLIRSTENLGFGRSNNLGLRAAGFEGDFSKAPSAAYLLNPDTITKPGATRALYDALFTHKRVGLVGAQLSYEDGSFQHGAFAFPGLRQLWVEFFPTPGRLIEGRFNGRYPRGLYASGYPFPVDFTLGATMMLRREVIEQTGMFDESFFMYGEEVDWAWRIQRAGWQARCVPEAHVVHLSGKSTGQAKARSLINLWASRLKLFDRYYPAWKRWLARKMIIVGMGRKIASAQTDEMRQAYTTIRDMAQGKPT